MLHYGQEIFEGLKAYRRADGSIALFRPEQNAERLRQSARRMALPEVPVDLFVERVERPLLRLTKIAVPADDDETLYIRPFLIADESFLGVRSAERVLGF